MRFESRLAFSTGSLLSGSARHAEFAADLPPEIAFLRKYHINPKVLQTAARRARLDGTCAARTLIAEAGVSASLYYRALARYLGLPFVDNWPHVTPIVDLAATHSAGCARLANGGPTRWLAGPTGEQLRVLLAAKTLNIPLPDIAITTPTHLGNVVQYRAEDTVEHVASEALLEMAPNLSAKGATNRAAAIVMSVLGVLCIVSSFFLPRLLSDLVGLLFLGGILFRLLVCFAGLKPPSREYRRMRDSDLPFYTVLVPLHREDAVVSELVVNLRAIDYPPAKLEIIFLVEPEDITTIKALASIRLPPYFRVVLGPSHTRLRTKPRALNIGLMMARGSLLTVYDAEDRPDPAQLRRAAAIFERMPETLACVQARLAMGNGSDGFLAALFAIEYATLFDLYNIGTAALGLPLALGGTSNHFRVSVLRAVGGWDAWNVTEDADLGLRLARLGYQVEALDSTTNETAPTKIRVWLNQRRRWTKGWMQTFLVLAHDAPGVWTQLGWKKSGAVFLMLINLVGGPLLLPAFSGLVAYHLIACGLPKPHTTVETFETILDLSVLSLGVGSTLWSSYVGLRKRGLDRFLPRLLLVLPYQFMISAAAWMGLLDLVLRPYHWHKTPH